MTAIAWGIFAVGLAVMVAFVWADWYDQRQQRRREQKQVEQERRQQKRNGRG